MAASNPRHGGGAEGVRPDWAPLLPRFLKPLGYRSYHSGKWHVDGIRSKTASTIRICCSDRIVFFRREVHFEDDQKLPPVSPDSGYYATVAIADHAIKCLKQHASEQASQPFFEYLAFTCPHFPLQALQEDIARYPGRFRDGSGRASPGTSGRVLRRSAWSIAIFRPALPASTPGLRSRTTSVSSGRFRSMSIHAGMVDRMDREIGRVLDAAHPRGRRWTTQ